MSLLRERLAQQCSPLHTALERSWEIARQKWLFSIAPSEGSYNSEPHFRNIEAHLERLLVPSDGTSDSRRLSVALSSLEIYLLLASVLFHDVGRLHGDLNHAYASEKLLHGNFVELGIPSLELATSLARIAVYHDPIRKAPEGQPPRPNKEHEIETARRALRDVTIEPYGRARELYVATLLALADHLDASAMRTEPAFVYSPEEVPFKGAFRRMVIGSAYDGATLCIKTCLHDPYQSAEKSQIGVREIKKSFDFLNGANNPIARPSRLFDPGPVPKCQLYSEMGLGSEQPRKFFAEALKGQCRLKRKKDKKGAWPPQYVLAIILRDLKENQSFLERIKIDLRDMGLPVEKWLLEYKGETYDKTGNRSDEPVFTEELQVAVIAAMKELSCHAFAHGLFSYQVLADALRHPNVELVRLTVHHLKRRGHAELSKDKLSIYAFPSSWELRGT